MWYFHDKVVVSQHERDFSIATLAPFCIWEHGFNLDHCDLDKDRLDASKIVLDAMPMRKLDYQSMD